MKQPLLKPVGKHAEALSLSTAPCSIYSLYVLVSNTASVLMALTL